MPKWQTKVMRQPYPVHIRPKESIYNSTLEMLQCNQTEENSPTLLKKMAAIVTLTLAGIGITRWSPKIMRKIYKFLRNRGWLGGLGGLAALGGPPRVNLTELEIEKINGNVYFVMLTTGKSEEGERSF